MATVYNIKLTSHWCNYTEEELAAVIKRLMEENNPNNEITIDEVKKE